MSLSPRQTEEGTQTDQCSKASKSSHLAKKEGRGGSQELTREKESLGWDDVKKINGFWFWGSIALLLQTAKRKGKMAACISQTQHRIAEYPPKMTTFLHTVYIYPRGEWNLWVPLAIFTCQSFKWVVVVILIENEKKHQATLLYRYSVCAQVLQSTFSSKIISR